MEMPTTQHPYITNTNNHLSYSNSSEEFSPIGNNMSPDSTGGANSNNFTSGNKRKASNESFSPLSGHHYGTESGNNNNNNGTSRSSQYSSHKSRKKLLDEKMLL